MTCSECRHHAGPAVGEAARRECRALAPQFAREVPSAEPGRFLFVAAWPLTLPADHCGAFAAVPAEESPAAGETPAEPESPAEPAPDPTPKPRRKS